MSAMCWASPPVASRTRTPCVGIGSIVCCGQMDRPLIVAGPGDADCARAIAERTGAELAEATLRQFPDTEVYLRIDTPVAGRTVWIVCTLHPAGEKLLAVYF